MANWEVFFLAGVLHDIGKFWQRTGRRGSHQEASADFINRFSDLFPYEWLDNLRDAVANHHARSVRKEIEKIVRVADRLASRERTEEKIEQRDPSRTPLLPVAARVEFREGKPAQWSRWGYRLKALELESDGIFPLLDVEVSEDDYKRLWEEFERELKRLGQLACYEDFIGLLALLRKYASFIPSATPWEREEPEEERTLPDISLYDHLRVTGALAACLIRLHPDHLEALHRRDPSVEEQPVARMLRADFSGIQSFLYRITRAESTAEFRNTAKRLRGRSFLLTLLADVTADWLARKLDLSPTNVLFCSGGRFDLLIGADEMTRRRLHELGQALQDWLLHEFHGELGLQFAVVDVLPQDLEDLQRVLLALEEELTRRKARKFQEKLKEASYFVAEELHHVCNHCHVTPLSGPEEEPCPACRLQRDLGHKLPRTEYLAYLYGDSVKLSLPHSSVVVDWRESLGMTVALLTPEEADQLLDRTPSEEGRIVLYRLNDTDFLPEQQAGNCVFAFKFLGNAVPIASQQIDPNPVKSEKEAIQPGEVLDFEEIASLSQGAQLLGVLRADVDYLGQVFSLGVQPKSISRMATLSGALDLFFAGWINRICDQLADRWQSTSASKSSLKDKIRGLCYIVYSGGDDLMILGPWDVLPDLAFEIYTQFRRFTCQNANITLSGGMLLVKPHFPIHRFAPLAGEQLEWAKTVGEREDHPGLNRKDRVTLFGQTTRWRNQQGGFEELLEFGKRFAEYVEEGKLPRSLIHFLLRLQEQHFGEGRQDPMWVPKLHYTLARRVSSEVMADEELKLLANLSRFMAQIRIPMSYTSLRVRKE
jgi:CRISPR-associated protein Csm1